VIEASLQPLVFTFEKKKIMARLVKKSPLNGLKGVLGKDLVFRQVNGETIVSYNAGYNRKSSSAQKKTRGKFREAAAYSKAQMLIPGRKAYYKKVAKKLKLPNAYTAAITEYMRKPGTGNAQLEKQKDGKVKVNSFKKGNDMKEGRVIIFDKLTLSWRNLLARLRGK